MFCESSNGAVLENSFGNAFVISDSAVPDKLHLWNTRNCFEVRMEDGGLRLVNLAVAMPVGGGVGVEGLLCTLGKVKEEFSELSP